MLTLSFGNCKNCETGQLPLTSQEASVTCQKCNYNFESCYECKRKGCPKCGGRLQSSMDWAKKNGIMF
jgi:protein-arginine kinase activator protein McsA